MHLFKLLCDDHQCVITRPVCVFLRMMCPNIQISFIVTTQCQFCVCSSFIYIQICIIPLGVRAMLTLIQHAAFINDRF